MTDQLFEFDSSVINGYKWDETDLTSKVLILKTPLIKVKYESIIKCTSMQ
jgi:hypothetical protein